MVFGIVVKLGTRLPITDRLCFWASKISNPNWKPHSHTTSVSRTTVRGCIIRIVHYNIHKLTSIYTLQLFKVDLQRVKYRLLIIINRFLSQFSCLVFFYVPLKGFLLCVILHIHTRLTRVLSTWRRMGRDPVDNFFFSFCSSYHSDLFMDMTLQPLELKGQVNYL